ncbi:MAG: peptidase [Cytophagaceae bacterium]|nr:peptidase [Cytophagaceae bacterium]
MEKQIIGRTDKVDFPRLGFNDIDVKIDTGAYTSSIHCAHIREEGDELHCTFLDAQHPSYNGLPMVFKEFDITAVRSSNGEIQYRYVVQSNIRVYGKVFKITLTLSSRDDMRFPVLLGRKFLTKKFIVDTELTDVSYNLKINENKDLIEK